MRKHWTQTPGVSLMLLAVLLYAGCKKSTDPQCVVDESYQPVVTPANFVAAVTNPLFPLVPGTVLTYKEGSDKTVVITVLSERKTILGVSCTTVHDVVSINGQVEEDTFDWYAQDVSGVVWYFGEDTKEFENGQVVSTAGSWTGGVDGAKPGWIIPASPTVGLAFRQEYLACEAEDKAEILDLNATTMVIAGSYSGCLRTHDFTLLDPNVNETKYYAPGVGIVLSVNVNSGEREELVSRVVPQ